MIEGGKAFGLALGTNYPVRVAGEGFWKDLQPKSRARRESRARHTSPIPPAPIAHKISSGPIRVPGDSGTWPFYTD
jgi:hypothetical protein